MDMQHEQSRGTHCCMAPCQKCGLRAVFCLHYPTIMQQEILLDDLEEVKEIKRPIMYQLTATKTVLLSPTELIL